MKENLIFTVVSISIGFLIWAIFKLNKEPQRDLERYDELIKRN